MTAAMLEQLEGQLATLPPGATKHDMEPGFDVMAQWLQGLPANDRADVIAALPTWLEDDRHPWHSRAAMELALRIADRPLLAAAIREARRRGVHDLAAGEMYPPWLTYHLDLLSTISRWSDDRGEETTSFLRDLRKGVLDASYPWRLLGMRAWFTDCLIRPTMRRRCLSEALGLVRSWDDARLLRSGLTLLHAYFGSTPDGVADLRHVLTAEEFAIACPELVAS